MRSPASHKLIQQIQNYSIQHKLPIIHAPCLLMSNLMNHSLFNLSVLRGVNANKNGDSTEKEERMPLKEKQARNVDNADFKAQNNFQNPLSESGNNTYCCKHNITIDIEPTSLHENETYQTAIYWFNAIIFAFLPLILIATFNSFLINALYTSHRNRREMTSSQVIYNSLLMMSKYVASSNLLKLLSKENHAKLID